MTGFLFWSVLMVAVIVVLVFKLKGSKVVDRKMEEDSLSAIKEIGRVAVKKHKKKFGRAPTATGAWDPEHKETR